ncbi:cobalamin-binding protein [candidate division WOR-3 bacterium]|uniref:Cobalamin-binding protein n=1 Tax=candidate division WOR-3 bacterium TaxID=2052148 RepID=A0A937XFF1_UNCW3|nr:cobalamin-binding protein [candidate division WOR-3 bacterium]
MKSSLGFLGSGVRGFGSANGLRRLVSIFLMVAGCGQRQASESELRVVSLVPSVTEIVYAVGAGKALVGNTNQCSFPEAARSAYKVGDFMSPDLERIVALRPSLVFLTLPMHRQLLDKFAELKIPTYVSRPGDIEAALREIDTVAQLLGHRTAGESLVAGMRRRLDSIAPSADTPRVYAEISGTPLMTAGGGTFINELLVRAGGRNVFASSAQEYPVVDPEAVLAADPEVILLLHPDMSARDVAARVGWGGISAVKKGRIYEKLDEDLLFRPGPRIVDGVVLLARLLHSETTRS